MGLDKAQRHRPGPLKQSNKKHKHGRHRSKGELQTLKKGKTKEAFLSSKKKIELSRQERRNKANQIRHSKREDFMKKRRGFCEAPFLIGVVSLNSAINVNDIMSLFEKCDPDVVINKSQLNHLHLSIPRLKQRFTLVASKGDNLFDTLDLLKVVDSVILLTTTEGIDDVGEITISTCLAQGLPTPTVLITDIESLPIKKRQEVKNQIQRDLNRWLPDEKPMSIEKTGDILTILRRIGNQKLRPVVQRDRRPHLLAESFEYNEQENGTGTLRVSGYLRGQVLSVNSLVHISGWGDFQMSQILAPPDPQSLNPNSNISNEIRILEKADPNKQESLQTENIPNPLDAEQTWPTEEEMEEAKEEKKIKKVKKIPKGMSEYQAAWIPDDDAFDLELNDSDDEDDDENEMEAESEYESIMDETESEYDDMSSTTSEAPLPADKYDDQMDLEEEKVTFDKIKEAKEDREFPDEVDTPMDILAKDRFQKYRGLLSFRTSPWDVKENLPQDYARIFQFQNFDRTKKHILKELEVSPGVQVGWYITIEIINVPSYLVHYCADQPIALYGLLPHENKMSVLNMAIKRIGVADQQMPIKSKEKLLFQVGFRRFKTCPIFSQHTNGNKHKHERFFQPDSTVVATCYAPVIYSPCSVLVFKEDNQGYVEPVACGNVLSVNPNRLIIKRVVLSGHLFKINKKSAVVRFMFFKKEDIDWFKPIELRTKYGRRGHIKESLGTHGHMKCIFNGPLKSQDTVLMNLYKRVFPKWTYDATPTISLDAMKEAEETENME